MDEAAGELVAVIREVRPRVMITYDDRGFYGHPDHIQAHRVAWRAFELAAGSGPVAKFYATALPRSVLASAVRLAAPGGRAGRRAGAAARLHRGHRHRTSCRSASRTIR